MTQFRPEPVTLEPAKPLWRSDQVDADYRGQQSTVHMTNTSAQAGTLKLNSSQYPFTSHGERFKSHSIPGQTGVKIGRYLWEAFDGNSTNEGIHKIP